MGCEPLRVGEVTASIELIKIRRGAERFWCEVLGRDGGGTRVRCDSSTTDPAAPSYNDVLVIDDDEPIFDRQTIPVN